MEFNERLQAAISKEGISQSEAARKIIKMPGVRTFSPQHLSKLLKPGAMGSSYVMQIAKALNVDPYWLATGEGQMEIGQGGSQHLFTSNSARELVQLIQDNEYRLSEPVVEALQTLLEHTIKDRPKPGPAPKIKPMPKD